MILTCPSCGTQYVVKDGAIPPGGRQVRCAACKHSWHQEAEAIGPQAVVPEDVPDPAESGKSEDESLAEATLIEPRGGPEAEERAYEEASIDSGAPAPPAYENPAPPPPPIGASTAAGSVEGPPPDWLEPPDDEFSPFPYADEFEPEGRSRLITILMILGVVIALAAAFWFLAPSEWKVRLGLVAAGASPLALVTTHMDRQPLESGNELLTVTGRVINRTTTDQDVPPLQAQLRSRNGQLVYKWTIAPPARTLAPGASASFNSAEMNVPPGGDELTITVGAPDA